MESLGASGSVAPLFSCKVPHRSHKKNGRISVSFFENTGKKLLLASPAPESDSTHRRLITGESQMSRFAGKNILITGRPLVLVSRMPAVLCRVMVTERNAAALRLLLPALIQCRMTARNLKRPLHWQKR